MTDDTAERDTEPDAGPDAKDDPARADLWLWRARFFKSRALAARFVRGGKLRVARNGQTRRLNRASATLRPGDVLTFARGGHSVCVRVRAPGVRRGPAHEAAHLYETVEERAGETDTPDDGAMDRASQGATETTPENSRKTE